MTREPYRVLPYADVTGNTAAANVDRERAGGAAPDMAELRTVASAPHLEGQRGTRPLTNDHCIAAIVAARIGAGVDALAMLANLHSPDRETEWQNDSMYPNPTEWWDLTPEIYAS